MIEPDNLLSRLNTVQNTQHVLKKHHWLVIDVCVRGGGIFGSGVCFGAPEILPDR